MAIATQDSKPRSATGYVRAAPIDALPPPAATSGVVGWLRASLFSSPANIILTILTALLIIWIVPPMVQIATEAAPSRWRTRRG